ncbi:uncharacterized protein LOC131649761 [Vicia villosa]|uniref:uncharacterized protein LOC131649761 n=1 Tax=Vicia villosa TaxID=3911 RepID=UPI00273C0B69|nr:uncharacterized protein LOC131649761 [Vicia villosa]
MDASIELQELKVLLQDIHLNAAVADVIIWLFDSSKVFTVKSWYALLMQEQGEVDLEDGRKQGLNWIWGAYVPSKLKFFGWRLLLDRLPTRNHLLHRGIIDSSQNAVCAFCLMQVEDSTHLFLQCTKLRSFWCRVCSWLDLDIIAGVDCCGNLNSCINLLTGKMSCSRGAAIWLTVCWCIWKTRNDVIFNNAKLDAEELFYLILWYSWWWLAFVAKDRITCNFYEWFKNPFVCI